MAERTMTRKTPPRATARKQGPVNQAYEERAKNLLRGEMKRRGIDYAGLAEKLAGIGVTESERNLANKISRGGFTAAFLVQCLDALGIKLLQIAD